MVEGAWWTFGQVEGVDEALGWVKATCLLESTYSCSDIQRHDDIEIQCWIFPS